MAQARGGGERWRGHVRVKHLLIYVHSTHVTALPGDRPLSRADAMNVDYIDIDYVDIDHVDHTLLALELPENMAESYDIIPDDRLAGIVVKRDAGEVKCRWPARHSVFVPDPYGVILTALLEYHAKHPLKCHGGA